MSKQPALKLENEYRSKLEKKVASQLEAAGIRFGYEAVKISFTIPERTASYRPDFSISGTNILLESKGFFRKAADRQRLVLIKEQHPELDLRLVFEDSRKKIYKKSLTTYAKWATDHGFLWSDKGVIPEAWIKEWRNGFGAKSIAKMKAAGNGKRAAQAKATVN